MPLSDQETASIRATLQDAVVKCSERCLYQSAKWAAELLNALPDLSFPDPVLDPLDPLASEPATPTPIALSQANPDPVEAALEACEINKYLLAKALFDTREFDRCAAVFLPDSTLAGIAASSSAPPPSSTTGASDSTSTPRSGAANSKGKGKAPASTPSSHAKSTGRTGEPKLPHLSQRSLFLALYAKFLSGEKRKDEEAEMVMGPQDVGTCVNKQLLPVSRYLEAWFEERGAAAEEEEEAAAAAAAAAAEGGRGEDGGDGGSQGWLEYLYGIVLAKQKNEELALYWLVRSAHLFPMNWGCWLEMTSLVSRVADLKRLMPKLPQNICSYMFHIFASLELYQHDANLSHSLDQLLHIFPTSPFLLTCDAMLSYHAKDLVAAESNFSRLLSLHPHRLDSLDHYSNILYVMNARPKLAFLAHLCSHLDKFRPESCVVIGNYYSLISLHEKAVQYFRRALTLDRACLSAWTLMGHEYVELKNTHAAIESYRRAVDVNRRDYRAWYGLGQTYEVLEMHAYALWYYKKAAGLRPWDGKMWMAVGSCFQHMGRNQDGIKALKRALLAESYYESAAASTAAHTTATATATATAAGAHLSNVHMDPEVLLQIATMYNSMGQEEDARAYMELCVAQEDGSTPGGGFGDTIMIHRDEGVSDDEVGDGAGAGAGSGAGRRSQATATGESPSRGAGVGGGGDGSGAGGGRESGTGVTPATSKARMWLAQYAMRNENYELANKLANELCQDGVEVEEAKALIREVRSRVEASGGQYQS